MTSSPKRRQFFGSFRGNDVLRKAWEEDIEKGVAQFLSNTVLDAWELTAYSVFSSLVEISRGNVTLCVPQLISTLSLLMNVADCQASEMLRANMRQEKGHQSLRQMYADYIRLWEKQLQLQAKPGSFNWARRAFIHPKYTKSYSYNTFMTLNTHAVELYIVDKKEKVSKNEISGWIQRDVHLPFPDINDQPIELWKSEENVENNKKKEPINLHDPIIANQKCPIIAGVSHFELSLPIGMVTPDEGYIVDFKSSHGNGTNEVFACKIFSDQPIKMTTHGPCEIIDIPTNSPCFGMYILQKVDAKCLNDHELFARLIHTSKTSPTFTQYSTLYLPLWESSNKACNFAQAIKKGINGGECLFVTGSFGDLGKDESEASCYSDGRQSPSIQHYDVLSILRAPDPKNCSNIFQTVPNPNSIILQDPFIIVIVDNIRMLPFMICRVSDPVKSSNGQGDSDSSNSTKGQKKCTIL